jgi:hypothetical protein
MKANINQQEGMIVIEDLKPCPFCGGEAECHYYKFGGSMRGTCQIRCIKKGCQGRSSYPIPKNINNAIKAWNTRAEV